MFNPENFKPDEKAKYNTDQSLNLLSLTSSDELSGARKEKIAKPPEQAALDRELAKDIYGKTTIVARTSDEDYVRQREANNAKVSHAFQNGWKAHNDRVHRMNSGTTAHGWWNTMVHGIHRALDSYNRTYGGRH
jgi:hypothetical protein